MTQATMMSFGAVALTVALACFSLTADAASGQLDKTLVAQPSCAFALSTRAAADGARFSARVEAAQNCMDDLANQAGFQSKTFNAMSGHDGNMMYCAAACQPALSLAECQDCVQTAIAVRNTYCPADTVNASVHLGSCALSHGSCHKVHSGAELEVNEAIRSADTDSIQSSEAAIADENNSHAGKAHLPEANANAAAHSNMKLANVNLQNLSADINHATASLPKISADVDSNTNSENSHMAKNNADVDTNANHARANYLSEINANVGANNEHATAYLRDVNANNNHADANLLRNNEAIDTSVYAKFPRVNDVNANDANAAVVVADVNGANANDATTH